MSPSTSTMLWQNVETVSLIIFEHQPTEGLKTIIWQCAFSYVSPGKLSIFSYDSFLSMEQSINH